MVDINKTVLMGRLVEEPDVRYTAGGEPIVTLTVATGYGAGENRKSEFTECVFFQKNAEMLSGFALQKGARVYVEGRKETDKWTAPDGTKKQKVQYKCNQFILLDPRPNTESAGE